MASHLAQALQNNETLTSLNIDSMSMCRNDTPDRWQVRWKTSRVAGYRCQMTLLICMFWMGWSKIKKWEILRGVWFRIRVSLNSPWGVNIYCCYLYYYHHIISYRIYRHFICINDAVDGIFRRVSFISQIPLCSRPSSRHDIHLHILLDL